MNSRSLRSRRGPIALVLGALLLGAWFGIPAAIRKYVDLRIESTQGHLLDFELRDRDGRLHRAVDLRGKTVVLNFFRSHCGSCLAERDAIRALAQRLDPERAVLLSVMMDPVEGYPAAVTEATLKAMDYRHPVLLATPAFVDAFHGAGWANVTPITYVADAQGRVVHHLRGHQSLDALVAALPPDSLRR